MLKEQKQTIINIALLSVLIATFLLFLLLSTHVWSQTSIVLIDQQISLFVYSIRSPLLTLIMKVVTKFADMKFITLAILGASFFYTSTHHKKLLIPVALTVSSSYLFMLAVKWLFARPRPEQAQALIIETNFSYPSGHTLIAITFYGLLIYLSLKFHQRTKQRSFAIFLAFALIGLIGFSRIYLGVHWASDVLASYLIGTSWLCFMILSIENRGRMYAIFHAVKNRARNAL